MLFLKTSSGFIDVKHCGFWTEVAMELILYKRQLSHLGLYASLENDKLPHVSSLVVVILTVALLKRIGPRLKIRRPTIGAKKSGSP
jgi:hypothetical protein